MGIFAIDGSYHVAATKIRSWAVHSSMTVSHFCHDLFDTSLLSTQGSFSFHLHSSSQLRFNMRIQCAGTCCSCAAMNQTDDSSHTNGKRRIWQPIQELLQSTLASANGRYWNLHVETWFEKEFIACLYIRETSILPKLILMILWQRPTNYRAQSVQMKEVQIATNGKSPSMFTLNSQTYFHKNVPRSYQVLPFSTQVPAVNTLCAHLCLHEFSTVPLLIMLRHFPIYFVMAPTSVRYRKYWRSHDVEELSLEKEEILSPSTRNDILLWS